MDIKHARRILVVGAPGCGALDLVKDLTGTAPEPDISGSCAGLTHEWDVKTAYYSARVPVWIDEISEPEEWKTEFMKPEAEEVVDAVGAWVYLFRLPRDWKVEETMRALQEVVEVHAGYGADNVMLAVAMPANKDAGTVSEGVREQLDDMAIQYGFEFVEYGATGKNEFGEKQGLERIREALEANSWDADGGDSDDLAGLGLEGSDDGIGNFGHEEAEMTAELFGMKASLMGHEDEDAEEFGADLEQDRQQAQVDDLDMMMSKLMAVKEQTADLPEAQRKKMAAKAVREVMGEDVLGGSV